MKNLYQPIKFRRWKYANFERGFLRINSYGETFLEKDLETIVSQVYEYEVDWSINF